MSFETKIVKALSALIDPFSKRDIIEAHLVQGLKVTDEGKVTFALEVNTEFMEEGTKLKEKAEVLLREIPEVTKVQIVLTASRKPKARNSLAQKIPGIGYVIAVGSGKGGVGKSTLSVQLARAFQKKGLQVGLLDGDIYGPSLPKLLGVQEKPTSDDGKIINPILTQGLKCMSMGFMISEKMPAIWRGPMVQTAFTQMLHQVKWGNLDVLVIDLPPGTGDVQLTLSQTAFLSGALIVSTPQDLALIDARRAVEMFQKVEVPILGLVENMSYFLCPHCEKQSDIFDHGGVCREAKTLQVPMLAEIPLHISIRAASEKGQALVFSDPTSPQAQTFYGLADCIWTRLEEGNAEKKQRDMGL